MGNFTDTFNRADGALGGNWATTYGAPLIAANWVKDNSSGAAEAINTTISDQGYMKVTVRAQLNAGSSGAGPIVKAVSTTGWRYVAYVVYAAGVYYLRIYTGPPGAAYQIATKTLASAPPGVFTLSLEWDNGTLTATIADFDSVSVADNQVVNGLYPGIRVLATAAMVDWVIVGTATASDLAIDPEVIGNYGECSEVVLTGTNTSWTDGTPGSPIFTVNHGTISAQTISGNVATLTYCPGDYLGTIVFTDPSTGETVGALVTSDPAIVPPTGMQFSAEALAYIERSAIAEASPTIANREMVVSESGAEITLSSGVNRIHLAATNATYAPGGDPAVANLADFLWKILTNRNVQSTYAWNPTRDTSLKEDLEYLVNELFIIRGDNEHTFQSMLDQLSGSPGANLQDIYTLVAALGPTDLQPVLDAIAALRGDAVATVKALADQLDIIRSIGDYTLATVKTWVEGVRGTDQPTIKTVVDAIAALNNAPATNLQPVLTAVAAVDVDTSGLITTLAAFLVPEAATVQLILDAIDGIEVTPSGGLPLWPGAASVTLGAQVALVDQLELTTPMHGVVVTVTTPPTRTGRREIGGYTMDYGVGEISFMNDSGYIEPWQYMGFRSAVYTPRTMEIASAALFRVLAGAGGTLQPWTRT